MGAFFPRGNTPDVDLHRGFRVTVEDPLVVPKLSTVLSHHLQEILRERRLLFLCIGTDRSTGDALGPLVGTRLKELELPNTSILGTLEEPVHAANLADNMHQLDSEGPRPLIVALDACLGRAENVGSICVGRGPLHPGAGVKKELPPVGELHITGTVNVGGFMEYFVLQNTRLSLVHKMAMTIASGIHWGVMKFLGQQESCRKGD